MHTAVASAPRQLYGFISLIVHPFCQVRTSTPAKAIINNIEIQRLLHFQAILSDMHQVRAGKLPTSISVLPLRLELQQDPA